MDNMNQGTGHYNMDNMNQGTGHTMLVSSSSNLFTFFAVGTGTASGGGLHLCCRIWRPVTWFASLAEALASWQMEKNQNGCVHTLGMGFLLNNLRYIYI